ncbi:sn-glycerol-3-phosphate ABC transporter permease UgpA [Arhodomonas sp. AD133]|uniref:sn-glycerol-3-phosphate ABC transporter permease UgpA n=1 Tax=Arhodomonas sp. AD133 TaxID=3415009 RepID=UPI003EC067C9
MEKRAQFARHRVTVAALVLPQLAITVVFFLWPAAQALYQSLRLEDPFGLGSRFVGLENFAALFGSSDYLATLWRTLGFAAAVAGIAMAVALALAIAANRVLHGASLYRSLLIWPYAIAPAIAGVLWWFLFNPTIGLIAHGLGLLGVDWNHYVNGGQAMVLIIVAAAWKQVSYNFVFFLAGLQAIPRSLVEAAAIDGAGPGRRLATVVLPLLGPTAFFLLVMNLVYAFFETFGIVHATTAGGPAGSTNILVYRVYQDGFVGLDLGSSAAQSVVLMAIVITLTVLQFRFVERRVAYA